MALGGEARDGSTDKLHPFPLPLRRVCCVSTSMTSFCSCLPCIRPVAPLVGPSLPTHFKSFTVQKPDVSLSRQRFYGPFFPSVSTASRHFLPWLPLSLHANSHRPVVPTADGGGRLSPYIPRSRPHPRPRCTGVVLAHMHGCVPVDSR